MTDARFRRDRLSRPIFRWARGALPRLSETERAALGAGDVWWDAELFTGTPDWDVLLGTPAPRLTEEEQAFLDGPCVELCSMIDTWRINWEWRDLPAEVWAFLREQRFFGMIIPKEHGGLGFSAFGHSEVIRRISTRSVAVAVTVMVPNSLGPGELLLQFGTEAEQRHWLPRLADGREIPCFGLTSLEAGSDAAAMTDTGVVTRGTWDGEEVLGLRLNWSKRYITLGPVATVLGLAFKMQDPDGLLGGPEDVGITVALVPTDLAGIEIGRRHIPCMQPFQNGPTTGRDVFVPIDAIIGGAERAGQGWAMLMSALAAGRGISLPSLSAAATVYAARTTGEYARIREQFGIPIAKFEGIQERLARLAGLAYQLDAARRLTCAGLDEGRKLAVISAIMKAHATYRMRTAVDDAMDVHAGKAIIDGPRNYIGNLHRSVPVGITVEGANILTRSLIIYGQGVIRAHPFLLEEMLSLEEPDRDRALDRFDRAFWGHVGHAVRNLGRAWGRAWSLARFAPAPSEAGPVARHYRQLSRYAAAFSLVSDVALLTLGGALKRREMLSARLGDMLSELYLLSAVLKRWEDEGRQADDLPLVEWNMAEGLRIIDHRLGEILDNLPNRPMAWAVRLIVQPFGPNRRGADDALTGRVARILSEPSATRDRLVGDVYGGCGRQGVRLLENAWDLVNEAEPLRRTMKDADAATIADAERRGIVTAAEADLLRRTEEAVADILTVDDFPADEVSPLARDGRLPAHAETRPEAAE
ncbi:MAG TPA: acyl-CoA dehydrogenase [Thermohalobaculum sp.]|nr:acyl-CoA dehydrogenase [Thermohalobaculum sp.]